jgi:hypothetical protein
MHVIKTQGTVEEQFHTFFTSALDSGQWLFSQPGRFSPGERTAGFTEQETRWAPEPFWASCRTENTSVPSGNRTAICRSLSPYSGHHTDWACRSLSPYSGHHTYWACPAPNESGLITEKYKWVETKFHHLFVLNWSCGISGVWCVSVRLCRLTLYADVCSLANLRCPMRTTLTENTEQCTM